MFTICFLYEHEFIFHFFYILDLNLDTCSVDFFYKRRPENVKLISDLPHNVCLCSYHENFIYAVGALHKYVPSIPNYEDGFFRHFVCEVSSMECWYGRCDKCTGVTIPKLVALGNEVDFSMKVSWNVWKKNLRANRTVKHDENGTMKDLIAHIVALSPQFSIHSFNKREQSEIFNSHDRPRAMNSEYAVEGLLQVDFAENFVCINQDEVQNAHWNQRQLSLFTSGFYYNENFEPKVFVSDNSSHTKETIVPYLWKLLSNMPSSLKILKIWSDGPSSQFKNKFMAALIPYFEERFQLKIIWNFFATAHGKGCVDGIGANVKSMVRKSIRARHIVVNNASDFVRACSMTQSKIAVEEMTNDAIIAINTDLKTEELFGRAKAIRHISDAHQLQMRGGKLVTFNTSKLGYN